MQWLHLNNFSDSKNWIKNTYKSHMLPKEILWIRWQFIWFGPTVLRSNHSNWGLTQLPSYSWTMLLLPLAIQLLESLLAPLLWPMLIFKDWLICSTKMFRKLNELFRLHSCNEFQLTFSKLIFITNVKPLPKHLGSSLSRKFPPNQVELSYPYTKDDTTTFIFNVPIVPGEALLHLIQYWLFPIPMWKDFSTGHIPTFWPFKWRGVPFQRSQILQP